MRYTRKDVEAQFERFVTAIGGRVARSYNEDGAYVLDHNGVYGGYNIVRLTDTAGGQTHVCGAMRRGPTAMIETLSFAIDAIEEANKFRRVSEKRRQELMPVTKLS